MRCGQKKEDPSWGRWLGPVTKCFRRMLGILQRTHVICDKSVVRCEDEKIGILNLFRRMLRISYTKRPD
jgi:hypothetical protein